MHTLYYLLTPRLQRGKLQKEKICVAKNDEWVYSFLFVFFNTYLYIVI